MLDRNSQLFNQVQPGDWFVDLEETTKGSHSYLVLAVHDRTVSVLAYDAYHGADVCIINETYKNRHTWTKYYRLL